MAKPFYRLQRFLRRTQFLFLFLGAAYIMAGSVLLLQRSGVAVPLAPRGAASFPPLPSLPTTVDSPGSEGRDPGDCMVKEEQQCSQFLSECLQFHSLTDKKQGSAFEHLDHSQCLRFGEETFSSLHIFLIESRRCVLPPGNTVILCLFNGTDVINVGSAIQHRNNFTKVMLRHVCPGCCLLPRSGYLFAGLEYGAECYCGNRITSPSTRDEECNLDCKGEKGSVCGGVGRLSVYKVEDLHPGAKKYRNVRYRGCFHGPDNTSTAFLVHSVQPNLTAQSCIEVCTDKELPLAVFRRPDCFCGYASAHFTLHHPAGEWRCARETNSTNTTAPGLRDHYAVYQTPVQDTRCTERKFLPEKSSSLVALSSFPGAGNTWVRHLIELATGYYTGSYYFDGTLYNKGFKGEKDYWKSGRTICVKTHESGKREIEMYDSAILLIRNPYRSLVAEFNRKCAGHLGYASHPHPASSLPEWPEFVGSYASWWASHVLDWLKFGRRVLVVHYEELKRALFPQLRLIMDFVNVSVTDERLLCVESNQDGNFKRSGARQKAFDPFTADMKQLIDGYIKTVDEALRLYNFTGLPQEYVPR
uniref:WSC domain containing 1 n=1 Tax=Lepisosteus oculatus TaxID=7918 RepID=W5MEU6_LEPOC